MRQLSALMIGIASAMCGLQAQAADSYTLPLSLASQAATAAVESCSANGYRVSATVLDAAGTVRVFLKGDLSTPHTRESSYRKAYTVATMAPIFKFDTTGQFAEKLKTNPSGPALITLPDILPLAGGVAIRVHGDLVAAIGVGGAPGGEKDEACAQAGVAAILGKLPQ